MSATSFKLHQATVLLDRIADDYLHREHGIRYSLFVVLVMAKTLGPCTQHAIAVNLHVSRASITQRVSALTRAGLLIVTTHPDDSRAHLVTLTDRGLRTFENAWQGLESRQDGLDAGVDEAVLAAQLDRLISNALGVLRGAS